MLGTPTTWTAPDMQEAHSYAVERARSSLFLVAIFHMMS